VKKLDRAKNWDLFLETIYPPYPRQPYIQKNILKKKKRRRLILTDKAIA